ncbi:MAG TPA: D-glycerate dehydrogenase [Candidatus Latescibacteria bacterium]|nr:D-glycerate dehydrogenase [Candidatus Latescibacterota bacterium]
MSWNVYVTREIPRPGIDLLKENCDIVDVNPEDRVLTKEELLENVKGRDGVLCLLTDAIDDEVFRAAEGAKIFANYAVGYDNIDVDAATRHKVMITNTPGVLTDATSDMAWALLFSVARRIVEADRFTREGGFKGWGPMLFLGGDITGKTLGIIGAGRIGAAVALKSKGFRMRVLYADKVRNETLEKELGARQVDMDTLLKESDYVSIHVPLMPETTHLIGDRELDLMKETAYLINTSRGPVVDEKALVEALREHKIAGAGLDVYEEEPKLTPGLVELENVVLAPHLGSATIETRTKMALMAAGNLLAGLRGEMPPNLVNPEVLGKGQR